MVLYNRHRKVSHTKILSIILHKTKRNEDPKNSKILLLVLVIIIAAGIALYGIHTRRTKFYDTTPKFSDNRLYADW